MLYITCVSVFGPPVPDPSLHPMSHPFFSQDAWKFGTFNGTRYHYLSIKSTGSKPYILLLHGFPNGPFGYHAFIPLLTEKGYGVILPELLGYGDTHKPDDIKEYAYKKQTGELAALLDAESVDSVVLVGHDFGSPLAARFAGYYPKRSLALILASTPYARPAPTGLNPDFLHTVFKPLLGYENIGHVKYFSSPLAPKQLDEHLDIFVGLLYSSVEDWRTRLCPTGALEKSLQERYVAPVEPWFDEANRKILTDYLKKTGLTGPTAWFRAAVSNVNVEDESTLDPHLKLPYLYISPEHDATYPPAVSKFQVPHFADITIKHPATGHWVFEEDPKGTADTVLVWLQSKG
ncbi:hypothetical protein BS47DRAFT_1313357, partial [Hydnum rufescens UP504]